MARRTDRGQELLVSTNVRTSCGPKLHYEVWFGEKCISPSTKICRKCINFDILHHFKGEKLQKYLIKKEKYLSSLVFLVTFLLTNI